MPKHEYYSRQTILKEVGESGQLKLSKSKALIVGAGGLGHPVATYLAAAGVGELAIIDFDKIEESNLNRQICFTPENIGELKAQVLGQRIKEQNPHINVTTIIEKLDVQNAEKVISQFDIIIDCCDNFATKFLIHDTAWLLKKDLIQASIYQYEGQIQSFNFSKDTDKGCLRCLWPVVPEKNCTGTCQEAGLIGAVAGVLGTIQAMETIKMILGLGACLENTTTTVDLLGLSTQKIKWKKESHCPLCSNEKTINELLENNYESKSEFEIDHIEHDRMILIDIRESDERNNLNTTIDCVHKPLSLYNEWKEELKNDEEYLFVCSKGIRSYRLVKELREQTSVMCFSLYGGLDRQ